MKILVLVNWKIEYCNSVPDNVQPPNYCVRGDGKNYWFFRHFQGEHSVDVIDISSFPALEKFEANKLHFYQHQGMKALKKLNDYDLIVSHGMPSAVTVSLWRRAHKTKAKHIVFDIGCFNSAAEGGKTMKLLQYASKSIDGIIYHTKCQGDYYKKYYPWLADKSEFIRFGADLVFFDPRELKKSDDSGTYLLCLGYSFRDLKTLTKAYTDHLRSTGLKLRLLGAVNEEYKGIDGIEQIPRVPIKEMINQIYNARLCVLPLFPVRFSYGQMSFLQQTAIGKCVVAPSVPSLEGYGKNGETAMFYTPGDSDSCADAIKTVLDSPDLEKKIIKNAKAFLQNECNEKIMARQCEQFFLKILNKK